MPPLYLFVCNLRVFEYKAAQNLSAHLSAHAVLAFLGLVSSRYARSVSSAHLRLADRWQPPTPRLSRVGLDLRAVCNNQNRSYKFFVAPPHHTLLGNTVVLFCINLQKYNIFSKQKNPDQKSGRECIFYRQTLLQQADAAFYKIG